MPPPKLRADILTYFPPLPFEFLEEVERALVVVGLVVAAAESAALVADGVKVTLASTPALLGRGTAAGRSAAPSKF